ncbi:MAG TPA: hypothetical protein VM576_07430 [Xanthomonadaceae bacterium]|nr:hypothetical protein [Xanthomonadaceae bacterium]
MLPRLPTMSPPEPQWMLLLLGLNWPPLSRLEKRGQRYARSSWPNAWLSAGLHSHRLLIPTIKPSADRLEKTIVSLVFGAAAVILVAAQVYVFPHAA